ncbi:hypothetical protein BS50DRAFT_18728 [Corynespora cassiicola Philippines]|uniref:Uncharacterized protein n=1 Tax=Corynespora cassiicola Philippines TaxID=1448308 RepID=A0A2T2PB14_CORCC|nr:hypothetical protein BS50DRAFT_18728 [Corynespora cassiicola Philippines]
MHAREKKKSTVLHLQDALYSSPADIHNYWQLCHMSKTINAPYTPRIHDPKCDCVDQAEVEDVTERNRNKTKHKNTMLANCRP